MKRVSKIITILVVSVFLLTGCDKIEKFAEDVGIKAKETTGEVGKNINELIADPTGKESKMFVPKEPKVTNKTESVNPADEVTTISLYLGDNVYYNVDVPADMEYITDNCYYVYAKDNSFNVAVISNAPVDNLSTYLNMKEFEALQPDLIKSVDGVRDAQKAAKYVANDKAIIVRSYDNPIAFATLLSSLEVNTYKVTNYAGMTKEKGTTEVLNELPEYTGYHVSVTAGLGDEIQNIYNFDGGTLTISMEYRKFKDALSLTSTKLAVINQDPVADKVYISDEIVYIEKGDYTIAVQRVNYNTAITLFGTGEEARYNIIAFLKSVS